MPKLRLVDGFKFGFGFFIGYEIAKDLNEILGVVYTTLKKRIKQGYVN